MDAPQFELLGSFENTDGQIVKVGILGPDAAGIDFGDGTIRSLGMPCAQVLTNMLLHALAIRTDRLRTELATARSAQQQIAGELERAQQRIQD